MVGYKWATSVGRYWGAAADHLIITTAQMWPGGSLPHLPATRQCSNPPEAAWATDRKWAGGGGSVAQWMVPYGGAGLDTAATVYLLIYRDNSGGTSLHHHQPPYHHCQHTLIIITHNITIMGRFGKQFHIQTLNNNWNEHYVSTYNLYECLNAFLHVCHEPSLLIYRRELGLISRKYYRLWQHPVFSVVVVGCECGVPITKRSYSFYKQSLYDGDQFVIMAVITKNNAANTRIHLYRQPATETWHWITAQSGTGKPQLICVSM